MYFFGANEYGQMGLKDYNAEIGENIGFPSEMDMSTMGLKSKIVDFDLSEKCVVVKLEDGRVFWQGLKLSYKAEEFKVPEGKKVKAIGTGPESVMVVTEDNELYMKNKWIPSTYENFHTGIFTGDMKFMSNQPI